MKSLKYVIILTLLTGAGYVKAQTVSVGADVVSSYVWRGIYQGGGVHIQPGLGFSMCGFSLGAWGSTNLTGTHKEFDLTAQYEMKGWKLAVSDYWWAGEGVRNYFVYRDKATDHVFEATVGYTLPVEKFPLVLSWSTIFAGKDFKYIRFGDIILPDDHAYSTYISADLPFTVKTVALHAGLGITPWAGMYADKLNVTDVYLKASKTIKFTEDFSLPVFGRVIANCKQEVFFVFGLSF